MDTDIKNYVKGIDQEWRYFGCYCEMTDEMEKDKEEYSDDPDYNPDECGNCQYGETEPYSLTYYISEDGEKLLGVKFPLAIGGPNVFVNTFHKKAYGSWGFKSHEEDLDWHWCEYVNEHFEMYLDAEREAWEDSKTITFEEFVEYYLHYIVDKNGKVWYIENGERKNDND